MSAAPDRRLLLVHAHPDDESINNGATMAKYAAEGAHVTLVTCTLGEEGEVIPPELAHLAPQAAREDATAAGGPTPLGRHRMAELADAMRELGVSDHRFLGGPGRYRDSGMMGLPTNEHPGSFWYAPLDEAALHLLPVIREVRPQVLVTYDPDGGYGHPDHIKAHRVAMRAAELAADAGCAPEAGEPHSVARIYWNCVPRSALEDGFARLRTAADAPQEAATRFPFPAVGEPADVPGLLDDDSAVDVVVDGSVYAEAKKSAMGAHATQISVVGDSFALSNGLGQPLLSTEYYRTAHPVGEHGSGIAKDLFAGAGV
ncbi:MAG TPA: N-acetyl-1-D-myo-inositol-2-amino-2-deoxy-alpha-D-glucopyranoside deacetylase [Streptomyces sp.]|nr:N-acetyl-1-D-myo-inositol-2-amino-2-deoxy-alpha-D-glucopyranoside deacetylase [Streptomyces sp.]